MINAFNSNHFTLISQSFTNYTLTTVVTSLATPDHIYFTNVYAPTDHQLKEDFLTQLQNLQPPQNCPWIILGDFNLMRSPADKNNDSFRSNKADLFNDTIDALALIELPLLDRAYTWTNNRQQPTLQKIDRVFVNLAWDLVFPNSSVSSLTRFVSDHVPLVVSIQTTVPRPATFRFENTWANWASCRTVVTSAWNSAHQFSNHEASIVAALKTTRSALKKWKKTITPINVRENNCKTVINILDLIEESRNLSPHEIALRNVVISVLQRTIREKVAFWKQRGKVRAAIEADENTRYFHASASDRLRRNKISTLEINGTEITNHDKKPRHSLPISNLYLE